MKRALAMAVLLLVLAPAAALVASVIPGCCAAKGDDRLAAPMDCCQTTICAAPIPGRQPKAVDAPVPVVEAADQRVVTVAVPVHDEYSPVAIASSPPPIRVRLALISTLLI